MKHARFGPVTAIEHGLPVITQDEDYGEIARAHTARWLLLSEPPLRTVLPEQLVIGQRYGR
ncbi:MAG TPA: hypothetical protein VG147_09095 [Solirubrobacteraceae bacterium]|nr:hypothetical protein [Solirubrobacteraceae bacterium]